MPFVVLKATDVNNSYGPSKATITKQPYQHCKIFRRYEHTPKVHLTPGDIIVYEDYKSGAGNAVTLSPSTSQYKSSILLKADVYYNKYENKTPLLLVLFFKGQHAKNRYYVRSNFKNDIKQRRNRGIDNLKLLDGNDIEPQILQSLIDENDLLTDYLTYNIDRTTSEVSETYNGGKIKLTKDYDDPGPGFTKYSHVPVDQSPKHKAFVLYNKQVLLYWNNSTSAGYSGQINQIQNIIICSMCVYHSPKIKEPLMIYLQTKDRGNDKHMYYFHKVSNKSLYWQVLDDIAFNNLLNQSVRPNDIHSKLTQSGNLLLISCLKKIENYLTKILIIMVGRTSVYSETDVGTLKGPGGETLVHRIANSHGTVAVRDISSECSILSSKGYTVYEHDFTNILTSFQPNEALMIKFIRSKTGKVAQHNTMVTINLDYQVAGSGYHSQSLYISVSNANNPVHKYKWYNHKCEEKITDKNFIFHFNGQYVTVEGDSSDGDLNHNVLLVYFEYFYRDSFIFVVFPNEKSNMIRILTYSKFKSNSLSGTTIKVSELEQIEANTTMESLPKGSTNNIDPRLLRRLQDEHKKLKSEFSASIDHLYYENGQKKLYVYLYGPYLQTLMICYNDKAYTRYFLGENRSSWELVSGINRCICKNVDSQNTSDTTLVESLGRVVTSLSLRDSKKSDNGGPEESKAPLNMDISRTGSADYDFGRITVTEKEPYPKSNLFVYCTHTPKGASTLNIDYLITSTPDNKTMKLESSTNAKYVTVYFNKFILNKPLVLCIRTDNGQEKYYKDLIKPDESYSITQDNIMSSDNLVHKLIEESDKINNTFTYQIDKINFNNGNTINYGNEGSITVTKEEKSRDEFISYNHKPSNTEPRQSYVLQNRNLLVGRLDTKIGDAEDSHGKSYTSVKLYSLTRDPDFPLLIEFHGSSTFYYSYASDENGLYWRKDEFTSGDNLAIKEKLDEINYPLKSSVIIELHNRSVAQDNRDTEYEMKLITNKLNTDGTYEKSKYIEGKPVDRANKIRATYPTKMFERSNLSVESGYKYVSHQIPDSESLSSLGNTNASIAGIRLFITESTLDQPREISLYRNEGDARLSRNRVRLYYPLPSTPSNKVFVYFFGEDTRPLLICYNRKLYKRINNKPTEWVYSKEATCYQPSDILDTLRNVYRGMKRKIKFTVGGNDQNISTSFSQSFKSYKKDIYTPNYGQSPDGPFVLSNTTLTQGLSNLSIVGKLLETLNTHTFDSITRYYKNNSSNPLLFEFADESGKTHIVRKDSLKYWTKEEIGNLASELSTIESSINETTVYEIDQTDLSYNSKIKVKNYNNQPTDEFNKYVHTPEGQPSNKSVILFNLNKLTKNYRGTPKPLTDIEGQTYQSVTVYFGNKAKNGSKAFPLIFELTISTTNKKYYKHKLEKSVSNWEALTIPSTDYKNKQLIEKLKETEFDLVESVVLLLEITKDNTYGGDEIQRAIKQITPSKQINLASIDRDSIKVSDKTLSEVKCISDFGYKVYEHDLGKCLTGDKNYGFRFFILTKDSNEKYNEINLYDADDAMDILYYDKNAGNVRDKVQVYFYGEDPRPLLACYNGRAYRPKSLEDYDTKWVKLKGIDNCLCQTAEKNPGLLDALSQVSKILNVVKLEEMPNISNPKDENPETKGRINHLYKVQKFKNKDIQIKVTYENKKCYRFYKHSSNGMHGQGEGYRLGHIKYHSTDLQTAPVKYESHKPLSTVSVFYSVHDEKHEHPLLVVLEFKTGGRITSEFYKLKDKSKKEWVMMSENDEKYIIDKLKNDKKIEEGLYDLRKALGIDFKDNQETTPLFKTEKCTEDDTNIAAIAGGTAGGLVGVGTIVTIGVVVFKHLAVTTVVAAAATTAAL